MTKIRLHLEPNLIKKNVLLDSQQHLHKLKNVLRLEKNKIICVFNGKGGEWEYKINKINHKQLALTQIGKKQEKKEEKPVLTLGFPLIQEKKVDFILQKATELGASNFIPFFSTRSFKKKPNQKKIERWKKIIKEASRQSERLWIPSLHSLVSLEELISTKADLKILAAPDSQNKLNLLSKISQKQPLESIICLIGPEGGFSPDEIKKIKNNNFKPISFSSNTLRTETASIFAAGLFRLLA